MIKYTPEEHRWTTGAQYTEQNHNGFRVRANIDGTSFWTIPVDDLKSCLDLIKILEDKK